MLGTDNADRQKCQNQQQLSISNGASHNEQYPFLTEFSDLIAGLSRKELEKLLTHQQKMFAKAIWEAENYGGSYEKWKKRMRELYGPHFNRILSSEEQNTQMAPITDYYKYILRLDHRQQWDKYKKTAKLYPTKVLE
jgi:RNA processing factor Prp31